MSDKQADNRPPHEEEDRPEFASPLLELRERPNTALAPSPRALGIWELAWPTMVASALQTMVRWADFKMVGDLGVDAVAGVGAAGQLYWVVQSLAMALTTGLVAILARAVGAGDWQQADHVLKQSLLLGTAFGLVSWLVVLPFLDESLGILGVTPEVTAYGSDYLFWLLAGNVPFTLGFIFAAGLRAAGDVRSPLYIGFIANILNLFLNWVLIYGNLGAPQLGVVGAGIASSAAMVVQLIIFWVLWQKKQFVLKPFSGGFTFHKTMCKRILHIGYPATIEGMVWQVGLLSFMAIMSLYGTAEFTAYQIGVQVLALSFLPGHGFSIAASTLVGQNLGAGKPEDAANAGWRSLWISMGFMSVLGTIFILSATYMARWFIDDDEVVSLTADFVLILGIAQPLMAMEFVLGGALRGAGDTRFPLFAIITSLFTCRVLPALVIALYFMGSIQMVWAALLLDYLVKGLLLAWRFRQGKWRTITV